MSQTIIKRLRAALAGSRGVTVELPKAFVVGVKSKCADCGGPTLVIEKRKERRRLMCSHCSRRVTVYGEHLPESV